MRLGPELPISLLRCPNRCCTRVVFGEMLADDVAPRGARRTSRLEDIVHHIGIALAGRPAATLARRLMLPVSRGTLLRVVTSIGEERTVLRTLFRFEQSSPAQLAWQLLIIIRRPHL